MSLRCTSRICIKALQRLKERGSQGTMPAFKLYGGKPISESGASAQIKRASCAADPLKKAVALDEQERARKAEKDEKIMNLICWGPNN